MILRVTDTELEGVKVIETGCFQDGRGFFYESWSARDFAAAGLDLTFVQDAHSRSVRGVLRGIHYQDQTAPVGKLVRCTAGAIFDVVVDLRVGSPTFAHWIAVELSSENKRQLYIPPGFGHGLQALGDGVEVQYKQTGFYTPSAEGVIAWNDPDIAIEWPIPEAIVSPRDERGMALRQYRENPAFTY